MVDIQYLHVEWGCIAAINPAKKIIAMPKKPLGSGICPKKYHPIAIAHNS
jgi:hypothetical protein